MKQEIGATLEYWQLQKDLRFYHKLAQLGFRTFAMSKGQKMTKLDIKRLHSYMRTRRYFKNKKGG